VDALRARKADLRREMVARMRALPAERLQASAEESALTLSRLLRHAPGGRPRVVGLYAATRTELPSEPAARLLASDGYVLAFPRVTDDGLQFHQSSYEKLTAHTSFVREPLPSDPEVAPDTIVIPGRAFDRFGVRLGHGAGIYDRALAVVPPGTLLVGYCCSFQVVDELPRDPHDRWVHWIVTDEGPPRSCEVPPPLSESLFTQASDGATAPLGQGAP
jgi:5-formyltetrahydrofolate cyclo-ligase